MRVTEQVHTRACICVCAQEAWGCISQVDRNQSLSAEAGPEWGCPTGVCARGLGGPRDPTGSGGQKSLQLGELPWLRASQAPGRLSQTQQVWPWAGGCAAPSPQGTHLGELSGLSALIRRSEGPEEGASGPEGRPWERSPSPWDPGVGSPTLQEQMQRVQQVPGAWEGSSPGFTAPDPAHASPFLRAPPLANGVLWGTLPGKSHAGFPPLREMPHRPA